MGNASVACGDDRSKDAAANQPGVPQTGPLQNGAVAVPRHHTQGSLHIPTYPQTVAAPPGGYPPQSFNSMPMQPQYVAPQVPQQPQYGAPMPQQPQFGATPYPDTTGVRAPMNRATSMAPSAMQQPMMMRATTTAPREYAAPNSFATPSPFWSPQQPAVGRAPSGALQTPRSTRTLSGGDSDDQAVNQEQEQLMQLNADRLERLKAAFRSHDVNGDGVLTMDEMDGVLKSLYTPSEEEIQKVVRSMDKNQDGTISWNEFLEGMKTLNPMHAANPKSQQRLKMLFDKFDTDGSGFIERNEYVPLVRDLLSIDNETRRKAFALFDANKDGFVTFDEFMKVAPRLQIITFKNQFQRNVTKLVQV